MSDSPTGEEKTPAQLAVHVLVLEMALKEQRESCERAFSQRDAAEAKFTAIRAENDDLLEEAAHNAKQVTAAQARAKAADASANDVFIHGLILGIVIGCILGIASFYAIL